MRYQAEGEFNSTYSIIHFPDDLCYWTSTLKESGRPETLEFQDDGYGNLIQLNRRQEDQLRMFKFRTQDI